MKKINNRGFMMIEVLVVSTFVLSVFIYLFAQFRSVNNSYQMSFKYNTTNSLYATNNIKKYLESINIASIELSLKSVLYVEISDCSSNFVPSISYCETLFEKLNVKKIYITKQDLTELNSYIKRSQFSGFEEDTIKFIKYIKYDYNVDGYRIIAKFNDDTFASLKLSY